jgi:23S rRNA (adenine2503-C2)-methyltransferase
MFSTMSLLHPFATTSSEFASGMEQRCQKGRLLALDVYQAFIRTGIIPRDIPSFRTAPALFDRMYQLTDIHVDPVVTTVDEEEALKFIMETRDGHLIESVIMSMQGRATLCISSQIGCRMGCVFCRTGQKGFVRNLSCKEIVQQLFAALHIIGIPVHNVVFMGMGEPFDNYDAVMNAVNVVTDPLGFGIGMRRVTISTSGEIAGIMRLAAEEHRTPNLAISLGAPTDEIRSSIMPRRRKEPLAALHEVMHTYCTRRQRQILLSYVLLDGVNDSPQMADLLANYVSDLDVRVNIIPYNTFPSSRFHASPPASVAAFVNCLRAHHLPVFIRRSRGASIHAACGQLGGGR